MGTCPWTVTLLFLAAGCDQASETPTLQIASTSAPRVAAGARKSLAIVLCKLKGTTEEPEAPNYFRQLFTAAGAGRPDAPDGRKLGNMFDFVRDVSYGNIDLTGTRVVDHWYTMTAGLTADRVGDAGRCASLAQNDINFPSYPAIVVIWNRPANNTFGGGAMFALNGVTQAYGLTSLDSAAWEISIAGQETLHALGLAQHSWSRNGAVTREYGDRWDVMSNGGALAYNGSANRFGTNHCAGSSFDCYDGPTLEATYRYVAGWMPTNRVYLYGGAGTGVYRSETVTLTTVDRSDVSGPLMARIPLAPGHDLTVEFRRKTGWDFGIPRDAVLVHDLVNELSYLPLDLVPSGDLGQGEVYRDAANDVRVQVLKIDPTAQRALVQIQRLTDCNSVPPPVCDSTCPRQVLHDSCGRTVLCGRDCRVGTHCCDTYCAPNGRSCR